MSMSVRNLELLPFPFHIINQLRNQFHTVKVSKFGNVFFVSSILPKNERKQFDLWYHSTRVEFFCSFFGRIEETEKMFRN